MKLVPAKTVLRAVVAVDSADLAVNSVAVAAEAAMTVVVAAVVVATVAAEAVANTAAANPAADFYKTGHSVRNGCPVFFFPKKSSPRAIRRFE